MLCYSRGLNLRIGLEKSHSLAPPHAQPTVGIHRVYRKLATNSKLQPKCCLLQKMSRDWQEASRVWAKKCSSLRMY